MEPADEVYAPIQPTTATHRMEAMAKKLDELTTLLREEKRSGETLERERQAGATQVRAAPQRPVEFNLTFNMVPERELDFTLPPNSCQSRTGAPRVSAGLAALPPGAETEIRKSETQVLTWLGASAANRAAFFDDPISALAQAGVQLERSQLKALYRAREATRAAEVLPPGIRVKTLHVDAAAAPAHFAPHPNLPPLDRTRANPPQAAPSVEAPCYDLRKGV
jgi:hypothetical protein